MTRYYTSTGEEIAFGFGTMDLGDWIGFILCLPLAFPMVVLWMLLVLWQKWYFIWRPGALRRTRF